MEIRFGGKPTDSEHKGLYCECGRMRRYVCDLCDSYESKRLSNKLKELEAQVRGWARRIENYPCNSMMSDQENPCFIETERVCVEMRKAAGGEE